MIAITGATGNFGKATIQFLLQKTAPSNIVAIVRNPDAMKDVEALGITVRQADYNDYCTLQQAFKNVEKALQISTIGVDVETGNLQEQNVVNALAENKVKHIVYTSMVKARPRAIFQATATHYRTEELIKATKVPYTFFRNSMYMELIPELIGDALQTGEIHYPAGQGKISFVSRADLAEAVANVLTENTHHNRTYEATGNKAYTFDELAQIIGSKKNMALEYLDISDAILREKLVNSQLPIQVVDLLISMANAIKAGEFSHTDSVLEKLLRRKSLSLNDYVKSL
jgi:NAD(P)H dehydrogenase (quinone)